jgi:hypothetical protein
MFEWRLIIDLRRLNDVLIGALAPRAAAPIAQMFASASAK